MGLLECPYDTVAGFPEEGSKKEEGRGSCSVFYDLALEDIVLSPILYR